jgi:hypothetical protein
LASFVNSFFPWFELWDNFFTAISLPSSNFPYVKHSRVRRRFTSLANKRTRSFCLIKIEFKIRVSRRLGEIFDYPEVQWNSLLAGSSNIYIWLFPQTSYKIKNVLSLTLLQSDDLSLIWSSLKLLELKNLLPKHLFTLASYSWIIRLLTSSRLELNAHVILLYVPQIPMVCMNEMRTQKSNCKQNF